ncbi:RraA family protein [Citricoccus sp. NR2]|uniref:RraA family protein n=1 Tax=Citricoccus sp. NR2 TaxID=3004095 RepID=UPI0022DE15DC|nr:RraA family protein [Citricoccus sp. NR2]WBL18756.1 RraA family protein [Citricoccus sp. NR2]
MFMDLDASSIRVAAFDRTADLGQVEQLAKFPVALIGDTRGRMGMMDPRIRPITPKPLMFGSILPVWCREGDNLAVHRALEEIRPGDVMVINAMGEVTRAIIGALIAEAAVIHGLAGLVVDGSIRDAEELAELGLPVYARGVSPAGPYKSGPGTVGESVACGSLVCRGGDVIIGDADGLIVLPPSEVAGALTAASAQQDYEEKMKTRFRSQGS